MREVVDETAVILAVPIAPHDSATAATTVLAANAFLESSLITNETVLLFRSKCWQRWSQRTWGWAGESGAHVQEFLAVVEKLVWDMYVDTKVEVSLAGCVQASPTKVEDGIALLVAGHARGARQGDQEAML